MKKDKEKLFKNPAVIVVLALICCALWGSAFPCVKAGYRMFGINGAGSQILFAGYRFSLQGFWHYFLQVLSSTGLLQ